MSLEGPAFNVVLVHPQIPPNTGNVGRLCVGTECYLHLVEPLAFDVDDRAVRRAGLDYWPHLQWKVHPSWESLCVEGFDSARAWFFSARARQVFPGERAVGRGDWLVFGRETDGLPSSLLDQHSERVVGLPQFGPVRSINLSNAVAVAVYRGLERIHPEAFAPGAVLENI